MILRCLDGLMDGAIYVLNNFSTNRKPDGVWFCGIDEHGRNVQHQYVFERLSDHGESVTMVYRYSGPVVETGIELGS